MNDANALVVAPPAGTETGAIRTVPITRPGVVFLLATVIIVVATPLLGGRSELRLAIEIGYFLALAQMWNLLAGYIGLISVGQQAFVGIGGYSLYVATTFFGLHPLVGMGLAGVVTGFLAIGAGAFLFRLEGAYFAIGTWVFAEVVMLFIAQVNVLGSGSGVSLPPAVMRAVSANAGARDIIFYVSAVALALLSTALPFFILRSRHGLALLAMRDNPSAAESIGIEIERLKFVVFVGVAVFTGVVGALVAMQKLRLSPSSAFSVNEWSATVIFVVVIGGIGRLEGPIVGAGVYFLLRALLVNYGPWYLICLGMIAIVIMIFARQGVWGLIRARTGIDLLPIGREFLR